MKLESETKAKEDFSLVGEKAVKNFKDLNTWEKFQSVYAAKFGALTEKDGIVYWKEAVDHYEWKILEEALKRVGEEFDRDSFQKKPKLGRVLELCRKIKREMGFDNPYKGLECNSCKNIGWRKGIYNFRTGKIIKLSNIKADTDYSIELVPCLCETGDILCADMKYSPEIRQFFKDNSYPFSMSDSSIRSDIYSKTHEVFQETSDKIINCEDENLPF
jgi:hypothetical protein